MRHGPMKLPRRFKRRNRAVQNSCCRRRTELPRVEELERRLVPAAPFTVNTTADTVAANLTTGLDASGHVSIRSALQAANNLGGSQTITIPAGTYKLTLTASN